MVILAVLLAQALPVGCSQAAEDEPVLCLSRLPAIRSIVVERTGQEAWREKAQRPDCRQFAPTPAQMRIYFSRARKTDVQSVHFALAESPCFASGRVTFRGGQVGRWRVDQFRIAHLFIGQRREMLLYCADCQYRPFEG